jgi:hypothetical protein
VVAFGAREAVGAGRWSRRASATSPLRSLRPSRAATRRQFSQPRFRRLQSRAVADRQRLSRWCFHKPVRERSRCCRYLACAGRHVRQGLGGVHQRVVSPVPVGQQRQHFRGGCREPRLVSLRAQRKRLVAARKQAQRSGNKAGARHASAAIKAIDSQILAQRASITQLGTAYAEATAPAPVDDTADTSAADNAQALIDSLNTLNDTLRNMGAITASVGASQHATILQGLADYFSGARSAAARSLLPRRPRRPALEAGISPEGAGTSLHRCRSTWSASPQR